VSPEAATVLTKLDELEAIAPEWRGLAELRGNPFLTPDWAINWFEHYGDQATPLIVVVRGEGGGVKGVLPLALRTAGRPRTCGFAGANVGDVFHPACRPGDELNVASAAGDALQSSDSAWTAMALEHVEEAGPWIDALRAGAGRSLRAFPRGAAELPVIGLAEYGDWETYLAGRSSHLRKRLRQMERKLADGRELRVRRTQAPAELERDFGTFFDLHDQRWSGKASSSLATDRSRAFLGDFAAAALDCGWLRLWLLELDGRAVAAWYGWRLGERYAFYNGGFDPELSKLSPGLVLLARVIEAAFEEGAQSFDFLLGDESYKSRFADGARSAVDVTLAPRIPHPTGVAIAARQGAVRTARKIPPGARSKLGLEWLSRRRRLRRR
jgi:CelD/BcsL family acetyltransferase involved in cellulose biosynthesis